MDEEPKKSENIIRHDLFDKSAFDEMFTKSEALNKSVGDNEKKLATVRKLAEDLFHSLYKYSPRQYEDNEIADSHLHNKGFVNKGMESQEYQKLRTFTKLQELESAIATKAILDQLMKEISDDELNQMNEQSQQAQELEKKVEQLMNQMQGLQQIQQQAPKPQQKQLQQQINGCQNQLGQAQQQLQKLSGQIKQTSENLSQNMRRAVRSAIQKAEDEVKDFNEFCAGWGSEAGTITRLPTETKLALAQKLQSNSKLREIAKMVGRYKRLALSKFETKISKVPSEIVDIHHSDDVVHLVSSELVYLTRPETKKVFFKKFADKELMTYDLQDKEKVCKGSIIFLLDESGSMEDVEVIAKSICLALLDIASKEKRNFVCIHFGSKGDTPNIVEITPKDDAKTKLEKILDIASFWLGGGTDFEFPLDTGIEILEREGLKDADLILCSDGEADISDRWLETYKKKKEDKKFRCFSICVGHMTSSMEKFSDTVICASDLAKEGEKTAGNLFELL